MRSKLFAAFLAVMLTALVSNLVFERLMIEDFKEYVGGTKEDRLYWILAAVEGSFGPSGWDRESLRHPLHWAMMLGFDAEVKDTEGKPVLTSKDALEGLSEPMKNRMHALVHPHEPEGEFEEYPLFMGGKETGTLLIRPLRVESLKQKEEMFKRRGATFLMVTFLIAGGGALLLSFFFSFFLSAPIRRLKRASESIAEGNLSVRIRSASRDEVGRLAESFNRMAETLQRQEKLRKHLTSNIAHELRTPLSVIKANIEAITDGVVEKEEGFKNISAETERLISLISGIEDMAKAEAAFFSPLEKTTLDLGEFLRGICAGMKPLFESKGLNLSVLGDKIKVDTDADKLEKIIRNILINSLKFTEKGAVTVDFGADKEAYFVLISDTGPGIPESEIPMIFERFYRGPRVGGPNKKGGGPDRIGKKGEGLGLGLSIAKELAGVMGGSISVESKPGEGTTFKVTIPL